MAYFPTYATQQGPGGRNGEQMGSKGCDAKVLSSLHRSMGILGENNFFLSFIFFKSQRNSKNYPTCENFTSRGPFKAK